MIQNTIDTHWEKYMCQIQYNLSVHQNICEMYFVWVPVQAIQEISRSPIEGLGVFLEKSRTTWHLCYYNLLNTSTVKSTLVYHTGQVEQWEQRELETHGGLWATQQYLLNKTTNSNYPLIWVWKAIWNCWTCKERYKTWALCYSWKRWMISVDLNNITYVRKSSSCIVDKRQLCGSYHQLRRSYLKQTPRWPVYAFMVIAVQIQPTVLANKRRDQRP